MKGVRLFMAHLTLAGVLSATGTLGCARPESAPQEPPILSVTHWTDRTELFAEHPPLVAGEVVRFAVHLTDLEHFKPLASGRPRIELRDPNGRTTDFVGGEPARPGIFRVEGRAPVAGTYRWSLSIQTSGLSDRHELGTITIYADTRLALSATVEDHAGAPTIAYLKEQQWTSDFATEVVRTAEIRDSLRAPATVMPVTGGQAVVSAPSDGRIAPGALPAVGARVSAGQTLARFEPRLAALDDRASLVVQVAEARAAADAAGVEYARAERLLAERAVPARRLEDARRSLEVARARLEAAEARLTQRDQTLQAGGGAAGGNTFILRAPIAGTVAAVFATPGAAYQAGASLFTIIRTDRVVVEASLPASDAGRASEIVGAALDVPGRGLVPLAASRITSPGVIEDASHALPLRIDVDNTRLGLVIGQAATAVLYTRGGSKMPVIPAGAIVTDGGRPIVFVQAAGEQFVRRTLELGPRDDGLVSVRAGVTPGERIVTRGAYEIRLAAAASQLPAEGHVH